MKKQSENFIAVVFVVSLLCGAIGLSIAYLVPLMSTFAGFKQAVLTYIAFGVLTDVVKYIFKGLQDLANKID